MKLLLLLTLVSPMMNGVSCLTCYKCKTSEMNQDCYDFSKYNSSRRNCPDNEVCGKITGVTRKGYRILIRDCYKYKWGKLNDDSRNTCLTYSGENIDGWLSLCSKDLCNLSTTKHSLARSSIVICFIAVIWSTTNAATTAVLPITISI